MTEISSDRLRNTRAWAHCRVGQLSGAEVIVAAVDEALAARERQWQPIETAPKDRAVWVAYDGGYKSTVLATTCACWFGEGELENNGGGDEDYLPAGWYEYPSVAEESMALPNDPLYWMPLPSSPPTELKHEP